MPANMLTGLLPELAAQRRLGQKLQGGLGQPGWFVALDQQAMLARPHLFGDAAAGYRNQRNAHGHGLGEDEAKWFVRRRMQEQVKLGVDAA